MERRVEKLKAFREERDTFFRTNSRSPFTEEQRKGFKGLLYYPIDLSYAMVGPVEKYPRDPKPIYVTLPTNKGKDKRYVKFGRFPFRVRGKTHVLQIYRPLAEDGFFVPFKDATSDTETHREGRYLFIEQMPAGKVLIDFNRAYNPFCEYNEKYTCPVAPAENWLEIPIRAGEKRFRYDR